MIIAGKSVCKSSVDNVMFHKYVSNNVTDTRASNPAVKKTRFPMFFNSALSPLQKDFFM